MPVQGKIKLPLTIGTVLSKISEYDIYRFYLGFDFKLGKAFHSPFHRDDSPSFSISITKKGRLHHLDFADSEKRGNCVEFVKQLFSLEYKDALIKIDRDFGLGIYDGEEKDYRSIISTYKKHDLVSAETFIQVSTRPFDSSELNYWEEYHVSQTMLRDNDVYAIKKLYINRRLFSLPTTELAFAYLFDDKWKIYRPFADKKNKWLSNVPNTRMSGMYRISPGCHVGVVTKAKKDELVLSNIIPHVCSVQSESTISINTENIKLLQNNCKRTVLNFDSDEVGVQNCKYYNQFGFGWVNCPKGFVKPDGSIIKDFADLAKYHGLETVINHFKSKNII